MSEESASEAGSLRRRLQAAEVDLREARETIAAIRSGDVDAVVVESPAGPRIFTLSNEDQPYRRLIEQIGEGALTLTPDGVILYCNSRVAEMLRMPPEKVIGAKLQPLVALDDRQDFERMLARGWGRHQLMLLATTGGAIPVHLTLTELAGDPARTLCGVLTDLTEQQQAATALRDAHSRLVAEIAERERAENLLHQAQKMEAVGQLTGGIAHDFNNLLTVIIGGLEMVERQVPGLPPGRATSRISRGAAVAIKGADRATGLIRSLLAFSDRRQLNPQPLDANLLIRGMLELMQRSLGERVVLSAELADDLWQVRADANQLENALLNVALNARDAMPNGGPLVLSTGNRTLSERAAAGTAAGDYMVVTATDAGVGMDEGTLKRAFEPFFTTKEVGSGSGLGLSQVYGFARQSGGFVTLRSQPGKGTTIDIGLPRMMQDEAAANVGPSASTQAVGARRGETVLVVEDNEDVRTYRAEVLRELGYEVLTAADGISALALLEQQPQVRLLFADIGLGGEMNGRQLADQALRRSGRLRVLLTTGGDYSPTGAGAVDVDLQVLAKPFTFAELATGIRRLLDGQLLKEPSL